MKDKNIVNVLIIIFLLSVFFGMGFFSYALFEDKLAKESFCESHEMIYEQEGMNHNCLVIEHGVVKEIKPIIKANSDYYFKEDLE